MPETGAPHARDTVRPRAGTVLFSALALAGLLATLGCPTAKKKDCYATGLRVDTHSECTSVMRANGCSSSQISDDQCIGYECDRCTF